ncbi:MAG: phage tail protein [Pseudomonadota bacterium]
MSSGSKRQTVGYRYFLGLHGGLCLGPIDVVTRIEVDGRPAWNGINEGGSISVNAENLFGGEQREGGVSGVVDIEMGAPDQPVNSYLQSQLGSIIPAFRGVCCAVFRQTYMGNNPYLKPWAFRAQRIFVRSYGVEQWYPERAGVVRPDCDNCDALEQYLTLLLGAGLGGLNLATGPTTDLSFPITTGLYGINSSDPSQVGELVNPDVALPDPCVDGAWGRVFNVDTFAEQPIPQALHFPATSANTGWAMHAAFLLKNDPDRGDDPVTASPTNIVSPIYQSNSELSQARVTFSNGTTFLLAGAARYHHSFRRNGNQVEVIFQEMGGATEPPPNVESYSGSFQSKGFLTIPESAWEDWLVISVSQTPEFVFIEDTVQDIIYVEYRSGAWVFEVAYNENAGTALPRQVTTVSLESNALNEHRGYFGRFFGLGGSRTITGIERVGGTYSVLDNTESFLAAAYTDSQHIPAGGVLTAFLANFSDSTALGISCANCQDMNPAHIIRECITDTRWGMGFPESDIDDTAFQTAADQLWAEGMGISIMWNREDSMENFIGEILRHIDGVVYVSRTTGRFVLKLIRAEAPVITLDEDMIESVSNLGSPTVDELTNSVTVVYHDSETDKDASVTVHDNALHAVQGKQVSTTMQYPGFSNIRTASRVAERDLRSLATPLDSCDIVAKRGAAVLNMGDAFIADWPDLGLINKVMRVNSINYGDGIDNRVRISCVQDVFTLPETAAQGDQEELWIDPVLELPAAAIARIVTETPYYPLVLELGDLTVSDLLTDNNDLGYLLVSGGRQGNEFNANVLVDAGSGFEVSATMDFHPYAQVSADIDYTTTVLPVSLSFDTDLVVAGTIAQIGKELLRVDSIDTDMSGNVVSITVGRGVLDTAPQKHAADAFISFWGDFAESDDEKYVTGELVSVQIQTVQNSSLLAVAPVDSVTFASRAFRPYPPGNLQIDALSYPSPYSYDASHTLTWTHRSRTQQTSGDLFDYTAGDIGPEPGTTYRVKGLAYDSSDVETEFFSENVPTGTTFTIDGSTPAVPVDTVRVVLQVFSVRDGYESQQAAEIELDATPSDPLFNDVILLIVPEGSPGDTTLTDQGPVGQPISFFADAEISSQVVQGNVSVALDNTDDRLPTSCTGLDLSGDWTIEGYFIQNSIVGTYGMFNIGAFGVNEGRVMLYSVDGEVWCFVNDTSNNTVSWPRSTTTDITAGTEFHAAAVKSGSTLTVYVDGAAVASDAYTGNTDVSVGTAFVGVSRTLSTNRFLNGNAGPARVTQAARYTGPFTPGPFLTS